MNGKIIKNGQYEVCKESNDVNIDNLNADYCSAFKHVAPGTVNKKEGAPLVTKPIPSIKCLFQKQIEFQKQITNLINLPDDVPQWYSYHMLAMIEELGEILKADKRWKTHRNERYVPEEKLEEIADVFITLMNICIFSGVDSEKLVQAVEYKIGENIKKLNEPKRR